MVKIRLLRNINPGYISTARGKFLDVHAKVFGLERKTYFWIFKESDKKLRRRLIEKIQYRPKRTEKTLFEEMAEYEKRKREKKDDKNLH